MKFFQKVWLIALVALAACAAPSKSETGMMFPVNGALNVNPDTHLVLTFDSVPTVGESGLVQIFDAADMSLVDTLDLSIPTSPNPSGRGASRTAGMPDPPPAVDSPVYQEIDVGGGTFHFRPIIVRGNAATIYPHNHVLTYGRTYVVKIEPSVLKLAVEPFEGFVSDREWRFTTKASAPAADTDQVVVAADGSGDFNTVQGAIDFFPARPDKRVTVLIEPGDYEEIVSFQNRSNLILRGRDRDGVQVGYANNTSFNPKRRWAFSIIDSTDIQLSNFTINNYAIGQAEALMVRGDRIILDKMTLNGSGDALTTYGSIYMADSKLVGDGDTILGYAALFCLRCEVRSIGPFTWTRTPEGGHGNVFVDSTFIAIDEPLPWTVTETDPGRKVDAPFARLPHNGPAGSAYANFPFAEMVLINVKTDGVPEEGWGPIEEPPGFDSSNVRFWEFNTMDLEGRTVDLSMRHKVSRQLTMERDGETIANYSNPEWVLGWAPQVID